MGALRPPGGCGICGCRAFLKKSRPWRLYPSISLRASFKQKVYEHRECPHHKGCPSDIKFADAESTHFVLGMLKTSSLWMLKVLISLRTCSKTHVLPRCAGSRNLQEPCKWFVKALRVLCANWNSAIGTGCMVFLAKSRPWMLKPWISLRAFFKHQAYKYPPAPSG